MKISDYNWEGFGTDQMSDEMLDFLIKCLELSVSYVAAKKLKTSPKTKEGINVHSKNRIPREVRTILRRKFGSIKATQNYQISQTLS